MDQEREGASTADTPVVAGAADVPDADEPIEIAGGVATSGRRVISEDWAATILGLVILALVLGGIIGKGVVP